MITSESLFHVLKLVVSPRATLQSVKRGIDILRQVDVKGFKHELDEIEDYMSEVIAKNGDFVPELSKCVRTAPWPYNTALLANIMLRNKLAQSKLEEAFADVIQLTENPKLPNTMISARTLELFIVKLVEVGCVSEAIQLASLSAEKQYSIPSRTWSLLFQRALQGVSTKEYQFIELLRKPVEALNLFGPTEGIFLLLAPRISKTHYQSKLLRAYLHNKHLIPYRVRKTMMLSYADSLAIVECFKTLSACSHTQKTNKSLLVSSELTALDLPRTARRIASSSVSSIELPPHLNDPNLMSLYMNVHLYGFLQQIKVQGDVASVWRFSSRFQKPSVNTEKMVGMAWNLVTEHNVKLTQETFVYLFQSCFSEDSQRLFEVVLDLWNRYHYIHLTPLPTQIVSQLMNKILEMNTLPLEISQIYEKLEESLQKEGCGILALYKTSLKEAIMKKAK